MPIFLIISINPIRFKNILITQKLIRDVDEIHLIDSSGTILLSDTSNPEDQFIIPSEEIFDKTLEGNLVSVDRSKENNKPLIESIQELIDEKSFKGKTADSLDKLVKLVFHWNQLIKEEDKVDIAEIIIEDSGYLEMLRNDKSLTAEGLSLIHI